MSYIAENRESLMTLIALLLIVALILDLLRINLQHTAESWGKEIGRSKARRPKDWVYAYRSHGRYGRVKIGRARGNSPYSRIIPQNTSHAHPLRIVALIPVRNSKVAERTVHRRFKANRLSLGGGREWFCITPCLWLWLRLMDDPQARKRLQERLDR